MNELFTYAVAALFTVIIAACIVIIIRWYVSKTLDKKILSFQNDIISKHCDEVQNIYKQMRGWRHDYHNHIQTLKAHLSLKQIAEIDDYLTKLDDDLTSVDTVIKTGNVMVDAILNSKLSLALTKKININAKAMVPNTLNISEIDLCVVIGNLLDNATEACLKLPNEADRIIRVYVDIFKDYLYISVTNSMGGEIRKNGLIYISSKEGYHGFGLMRVDKIVQKYGGHINRQNEQGVFATEVMLPIQTAQ